MKVPKPAVKYNRFLKLLFSVVLLIAGVWVLAVHWGTVSASLHAARHADGGWLLFALACTALTYLVAAAIYGALALHPLRYRQTVLIEVSTAFVNRLLPSGIGGLGVHGVYLYRRKHTVAEATAVVSANNLLGMTGHLTFLAVVCLVHPVAVHELASHWHFSFHWWAVLVALVLIVMISLSPLRQRVGGFVGHLLQSLRKIGLSRTARALILALVLTSAYTLVLFAAARAVGIRLEVLQIFIVFSIGMLLGTASPTPGGLVGAEAGLFTGFVGYGIHSTAAGAAVVLYRLCTYWIPLLPGLAALWLARRRKLV